MSYFITTYEINVQNEQMQIFVILVVSTMYCDVVMYVNDYIIVSFCYYFSETRLVLLVMFCSQGDNILDAVSMATHLDGWLNLVSYVFIYIFNT